MKNIKVLDNGNIEVFGVSIGMYIGIAMNKLHENAYSYSKHVNSITSKVKISGQECTLQFSTEPTGQVINSIFITFYDIKESHVVNLYKKMLTIFGALNKDVEDDIPNDRPNYATKSIHSSDCIEINTFAEKHLCKNREPMNHLTVKAFAKYDIIKNREYDDTGIKNVYKLWLLSLSNKQNDIKQNNIIRTKEKNIYSLIKYILLILIVIIGFLYVQNNRYEYSNNNRIRADKWTGTVYHITYDGWEEMN